MLEPSFSSMGKFAARSGRTSALFATIVGFVRPSRPSSIRVVACFAVIALVVGGCNGGTGDGDGAPGEGAASSQPDDGCPESFPRRLEVTTDRPDEVPYLDQLAACTAPGQDVTFLKNDSDAVWTLETTEGGAKVEQLTRTTKLASFREAAVQAYPHAVLAPESSVRVYAHPSRLQWFLAPGLSAMWLFHEQLVEVVQKQGQEQLTDMLSRQSLRRKALLTCTFAAYKVAGEAGGGLTGPDPAKRFFAGLGIASETTSCGRSWLLADDQPRSRLGTTATGTGDDVARWASRETFIEKANTHLTRLNRLGKLLAVLR
jgi:hypothetical protein